MLFFILYYFLTQSSDFRTINKTFTTVRPKNLHITASCLITDGRKNPIKFTHYQRNSTLLDKYKTINTLFPDFLNSTYSHNTNKIPRSQTRFAQFAM